MPLVPSPAYDSELSAITEYMPKVFALATITALVTMQRYQPLPASEIDAVNPDSTVPTAPVDKLNQAFNPSKPIDNIDRVDAFAKTLAVYVAIANVIEACLIKWDEVVAVSTTVSAVSVPSGAVVEFALTVALSNIHPVLNV